ncbi:hypothetical protein [Agrobacterium vitis]|uniref:hypothetical protein n=1 Tax=Agrobacterium vitis TaxID=373 RepID=UPI0012E89DD5|nr:hypothetical protein [Agrobacterium vitis]MVA64011.1 hypothetical protein [Agrobacterium vitis]
MLERKPSFRQLLSSAKDGQSSSPDIDPDDLKELVRRIQIGDDPVSRELAAVLVREVGGYQTSHETIKRIEVGSKIKAPRPELLKAMFLAYGLTDAEAADVAEYLISGQKAGNPHLHSATGAGAILAVAEFGPQVANAERIGSDWMTTWVEVRKADEGGFEPHEVEVIVKDEEVNPPKNFKRLATLAAQQNEERRKAGAGGVWSDNPTLCLAEIPDDSATEVFEVQPTSVVDSIAGDRDERLTMTLHLKKSTYRYNVIAKQEAGASERWNTLQNLSFPPTPVPHLASGVGICINVVCDNGASIVVGRRSLNETFRKGEFDIAVVEGIRPTADVAEGKIDVQAVARRALTEELGFGRGQPPEVWSSLLNRLVVFEFGVDLEYYQWNFLAFADTKLSFAEIDGMWRKAKDRKENTGLRAVPSDRDSLTQFFMGQPIWSAGMACAQRTFDYW